MLHKTSQQYQSLHKMIGLSLVLLTLSILSGCSDNGISVTSRFDNTQDIKEGAIVYFEDEAVGSVNDVSRTENGSLVQLNIDVQAAQQISGQAALIVNRLKEGAPLEIYNSTHSSSEPLVAGQEIAGLDSMFQLGAWMLGDALKVGSSSVSEYVDAFQQYLSGEDFQNDKTQVQDQIGQATQQAMETVEKEVNQAMAEMKAVEGEMAEAVKQLGDELSPVVKELSKSGSLLVEQLEQFTKGLEQSQQSEQQAGKNFMESLLTTLEKLNQSMEEGIKEGADDSSSPMSSNDQEPYQKP